MSDFFVGPQPNYFTGFYGNTGGSAPALGPAAAAYNQAMSPTALYGPGGFGAQTAAAAAAGAAYGRATGGFQGVGDLTSPQPSPAPAQSDVSQRIAQFQQGLPDVNSYAGQGAGGVSTDPYQNVDPQILAAYQRTGTPIPNMFSPTPTQSLYNSGVTQTDPYQNYNPSIPSPTPAYQAPYAGINNASMNRQGGAGAGYNYFDTSQWPGQQSLSQYPSWAQQGMQAPANTSIDPMVLAAYQRTGTPIPDGYYHQGDPATTYNGQSLSGYFNNITAPYTQPNPRTDLGSFLPYNPNTYGNSGPPNLTWPSPSVGSPNSNIDPQILAAYQRTGTPIDPSFYNAQMGGYGGMGGAGNYFNQSLTPMSQFDYRYGSFAPPSASPSTPMGSTFNQSDLNQGIQSMQDVLKMIDSSTAGGDTLNQSDRNIPFMAPGVYSNSAGG